MRYFVQRATNYLRNLFGNPWKEAIIEALEVDHILTIRNENDPKRALNDLLAWEQIVALDPRVSSSAAELIQRGREQVLSGADDLRGEQCEHGWFSCKRCAAVKPTLTQELSLKYWREKLQVVEAANIELEFQLCQARSALLPAKETEPFVSAEWFAQAVHDIMCYPKDIGENFRTAPTREPFKSRLRPWRGIICKVDPV